MGLFDFFKKKDKAPNLDAKVDPSDQVNNSITRVSSDDGTHGDNFGALVGFEALQRGEVSNFINDHITQAANQRPIMSHDQVTLHEVRLDGGEHDSRIGVRAIVSRGSIISGYPYISTAYTIPFKTKKIVDWSHVEDLEAEVIGGGRDTFGLGFFATDYAVHRRRYAQSPSADIKISAIALVMDQHRAHQEADGLQFADNFASYMPSKQLPRPTYYDFIGVVVDHHPVQLSDTIRGHIVRTRLINQESDPDFFTVDLFVNQENMRFERLEKGKQVAGLLWFQGELS